ncbi:MAG: glycoside hydrolase family 26 protein [Chitinophagaceae bacterium]
MPQFIPVPIDSMATPQTKQLYFNLHRLAQSKFTMFGHQDSLAYGRGWAKEHWNVGFPFNPNPNNAISDVYDTLDKKQYPGLFGWDIGHIEDPTKNALINYITQNALKSYIKKVYDMGGVNTVCWHMNNPIDNSKTAWDSVVNSNGKNITLDILLDETQINPATQQSYLQSFLRTLDVAAAFFKSLKGSDGNLIPIIFRPFHECSFGNCFWWNDSNSDKKNYKKLWTLTVDYLKNNCGVHNLLYAFNMHDNFTQNDFIKHYPDNGYVDIISYDIYQQKAKSSASFIQEVQQKTKLLIQLAQNRNKVAAIGEIGYNNFMNQQQKIDKKWFTKTLQPALANLQIAYFMLWRNAKGKQIINGATVFNDTDELNCTYPTHTTSADFNEFFKARNIIFSKTTAARKMYL